MKGKHQGDLACLAVQIVFGVVMFTIIGIIFWGIANEEKA